MKDPNRRHANLDAIAPWLRRSHARRTGDKCERSQYLPATRQARRLERERQEKRRLNEELKDEG